MRHLYAQTRWKYPPSGSLSYNPTNKLCKTFNLWAVKQSSVYTMLSLKRSSKVKKKIAVLQYLLGTPCTLRYRNLKKRPYVYCWAYCPHQPVTITELLKTPHVLRFNVNIIHFENGVFRKLCRYFNLVISLSDVPSITNPKELASDCCAFKFLWSFGDGFLI